MAWCQPQGRGPAHRLTMAIPELPPLGKVLAASAYLKVGVGLDADNLQLLGQVAAMAEREDSTYSA